jgi:hypothetical protein
MLVVFIVGKCYFVIASGSPGSCAIHKTAPNTIIWQNRVVKWHDRTVHARHCGPNIVLAIKAYYVEITPRWLAM